MSNYAIRVHGLSKKYRIGTRERYRMLRDVIRDVVTNSRGEGTSAGKESSIWALKNVSFDMQPGGSLGIIGNNGAGKSTLLKILSRITKPTEGYAHIRGRVGSLLEVGTGFHPELTGRENVYLNGAILGMRKNEIDQKFDQIVAFSEVEDFLDTPVKFYSSGMRVRLAFSVAAHLEPEILLIDEVLAVGDLGFQKKSITRMGEVARDGRSVIFVSHNMAAMRSLCRSGVYLHKGEIRFAGEVNKAVDAYINSGEVQKRGEGRIEILPDEAIAVQFLSAAILGPQGDSVSAFSFEQPFTVEFQVVVRRETPRVRLELSILDSERQPILSSYDFEGHGTPHYPKGTYTFRVAVPPILSPGEYSLNLQAFRKARRTDVLHHAVNEVCPFEIVDSGSPRLQAKIRWKGPIAIPLKWEIRTFPEPQPRLRFR